MKKYLLFGLFFMLTAVFYLAHDKKQPPSEAEKQTVSTLVAEIKKIPFTYKTVGIAAPLQEVNVRPQISGKITKIFFDEGTFVQKNEIIAQIDDATPKAELAKAQAEQAVTQAKFNEAEKNLVRYRKLSKNSVVSQKTLEEQESLFNQLAASLSAEKAQIETMQTTLNHTKITAPISGRIGLIQTHEGNLIAENDSVGIAKITQISPLSVVFSLPQKLFYTLQHTDTSSVEIYDDDNNFIESGKISAYDNSADSQTGTVNVRAIFANAKQNIWPGQTLGIRFLYGQNTKHVVLPNGVIRPGSEGSYVFKLEKEKVVITPISVDYKNDEDSVVTSGIEVGDIIVCNNFSRLKNGLPVKAKMRKKNP